MPKNKRNRFLKKVARGAAVFMPGFRIGALGSKIAERVKKKKMLLMKQQARQQGMQRVAPQQISQQPQLQPMEEMEEMEEMPMQMMAPPPVVVAPTVPGAKMDIKKLLPFAAAAALITMLLGD